MRHNTDNHGDGSSYIHQPVLWREIASFIEKSYHRGRGTLVDATLGEGGHTEILLGQFQELSIVGFDRDGDIMEIARKRLSRFGGRVVFCNMDFSHIAGEMESMGRKADYCLYDFGVSSYHFDAPGRGFSFSSDEALDMRLDRRNPLDARDVVNTYDEKELAGLIYRYGDERWGRKIASAICRARKVKPVETTRELADIVLGAIPKRFHVKNIHPATRVFQAVRIEVNNELGLIEESLAGLSGIMSAGGMTLALSYHSLEDRIVKRHFKMLEKGCTCGMDGRKCYCTGGPLARLITKKPVRPSDDEVNENSRSRSARLRVCEKL